MLLKADLGEDATTVVGLEVLTPDLGKTSLKRESNKGDGVISKHDAFMKRVEALSQT